MRKKGLIVLLVLIAIFVALGFLFTDQWIEKQLESVGASVVGAKVEIDGLDLSLLGLHAGWDSLQVTDPKNTMENLIATGACELDFRLLPLFSKKVIIDAIAMRNVQSGVPRTTDGKIEKKPEKPKTKSDKPSFLDKTVDKLSAEMENTPVFQMDSFTRKINVDSLIALLSVQSPHKIDSLYQSLTGQYEQIQTQIKDLKPKEEIDALQKLIESIQIDQIKDLNTLVATLETVQTIQKRLNTLYTQVNETNQDVQTLVSESGQGTKQVEDWIQNDYQQALSKAQLPEITAQNVGKILFGKKIVYQVTRVLNITKQVRYYASKLQSDKPKKEKPPRLKGQDIAFPLRHALPEFWIHEIELSGRLKQIDMSGNVTDITTNQKLIGQPTHFVLSGQNEVKTSITLEGILDYLSSPKETFRFALDQWPLEGIRLSESPLLPYAISNGKGRISSQLAITGDTLKGKIQFTGSQMAFDLSRNPTPNRAEVLIQNVLKKANTVEFTSDITAIGDNMTFRIRSNMDDLIVKEIQSLASQEVASAKRKLQQEIENRIAGPKKELTEFVSTRQKQLEETWAEYQKTIDEQKQKIEQKQKDLEKRIEDEKKKQENKLGNEVKNKINDLLK